MVLAQRVLSDKPTEDIIILYIDLAIVIVNLLYQIYFSMKNFINRASLDRKTVITFALMVLSGLCFVSFYLYNFLQETEKEDQRDWQQGTEWFIMEAIYFAQFPLDNIAFAINIDRWNSIILSCNLAIETDRNQQQKL